MNGKKSPKYQTHEEWVKDYDDEERRIQGSSGGANPPPCPTCKAPTEINYNWVQSQSNGNWLHECWECENVFETSYEVITGS